MYRMPPSMRWPFWKYVLLVLFMQAIFTFVVWLHRSILYDKSALSVSDVVYGSGPALFAFWQWWVWKKHKGNRWLIWAGNLFINLYLPALFLGGAISTWRILLNKVPLVVVTVFLLLTFSGMWALPWLSSSRAKALHDLQWQLSGLMLGLIGVAGIIGASIGIFSARSGTKGAEWMLGLLLSLLAIGLAQHTGYISWIYRPWAKEEE